MNCIKKNTIFVFDTEEKEIGNTKDSFLGRKGVAI